MERANFLGGTDASAILGLNPYKTSYDVFLEKTKQVPPIPDNPAMYWGRALEPLVINKYEEETKDCVPERSLFLEHKKYKFIAGNLDGLSHDFVIEAKTARTADKWGADWTDEIPDNYLVQCQHYMMLTGKRAARVPVLFGASDFHIYEINTDPDFQAQMLEELVKWWETYILNNQELLLSPPAQNSSDILKMYKKSNGQSIHANSQIQNAVNKLTSIKIQAKELGAEQEELEEAIKIFLGENEALISNENKTLITWKYNNGRKFFDSKKLEQDMPDIYKQYTSLSAPSRSFLVK